MLCLKAALSSRLSARRRKLYGEQARFFQDEINPKLKHKTKGTVGSGLGPFSAL